MSERRRTLWALLVAGFLVGGVAHGQDVALPEPVAASSEHAKTGEPEVALDADREIDLANIVVSAAKGVTTVQEAPSIVTIITAEELKSRGFKEILQAIGTVPGWMNAAALGNSVDAPIVRGLQQGALVLRDGISMFDPFGNTPGLNRAQPIEVVKRLELVTGPGGVLWGANSFLGIVNIIGKDAEDVNGLEVSAGYGDGPGNVQDVRAYAMFGKTFFHNKLKIFQHISYENYVGPTWTLPTVVANEPAPQPAGPVFYGVPTGAYPERSWILYLDGKYSMGPFSLYYAVPFGQMNQQVSFYSAIAPKNTWTIFDRYGILEYKHRFFKDRFGLAAKGYYSQFVRGFGISLFPASPLFPPVGNLPGGLRLAVLDPLIQRYGGTIDADANLPFNIRLLFGGEVFRESLDHSVSSFSAPPSPSLLPITCPLNPDGSLVATCPRQFVNDSNRIVVAAYLDAQWRPFQKLTLDGGVRLQQAWGSRPYALQVLASAAAVWNFLPNFHVKGSYASGFRPPVFINTDSVAGGVNIGSNPRLNPEQSQSFQGELNARLLRNVRIVRALELRLDYSYSFVKNLIQIQEGSYQNTGTRAMHSVEFYGKLFLTGDHYIQLSYTYLRGTGSDKGTLRFFPNHWFVLGGVFNLIKNMLDLNANLNVFSAYEDPNRYASTSDSSYGAKTHAGFSDLTFDRLTPVALLQLGGRLRLFKEKMAISAQFFNVLNQRYWYPDAFYDLTPTNEGYMTPAPGFSFFASVTYHP